ncbi:hypothetical protein DNTS_005532 [Danionella cerebrum]|uniref:Uncharacterized protein n=1 Tax=Danionella cerebrum TaxID=2873325 RepID=A0A553NJT4_9TELE|nr:hypothetical protein DNTS_005532 [Danionella translucida]
MKLQKLQEKMGSADDDEEYNSDLSSPKGDKHQTQGKRRIRRRGRKAPDNPHEVVPKFARALLRALGVLRAPPEAGVRSCCAARSEFVQEDPE